MRRFAAVLAALALVAAQPVWAQETATPPAAAAAPTQTLPPADEVQSFEPGEQPPAPRPAAGVPASPAEPAANAAPAAGDTTMADPTTEPAVDPSALPHDLSPWGMFVAADWVVKAVMIGLAFASVVTWTVWLAKSLEILSANRRAKAGLAAVQTARALDDARRSLRTQRGPVPAFVAAADAELISSSDALSPDGVKERVASHLSRLEAQAGRKLAIGTGVLATIGSTAPFVGLFGTVWGIMNSFIGISNAQTTNLAVVAPGIAEALLATAIGLVAAIPAVMIYNVFARAISAHRALLADASAAVLRLVSRDLDRGIAPRLARAAE